MGTDHLLDVVQDFAVAAMAAAAVLLLLRASHSLRSQPDPRLRRGARVRVLEDDERGEVTEVDDRGRVWVLLDGAAETVWYAPHDLRVCPGPASQPGELTGIAR